MTKYTYADMLMRSCTKTDMCVEAHAHYASEYKEQVKQVLKICF